MCFKKVIYAHGIQSGGGLTLLKEVLSAVENDTSYKIILDTRVKEQLSSYNLTDVEYFKPGFFGRLRSELKLRRSRYEIKRIFSFNSLPFIIPIKVSTTIFFQNVNLICPGKRAGWSSVFKSKLFKLTAFRVNLFIVQTRSVEFLVTKSVGRPCNIQTLLEPSMTEHMVQCFGGATLTALSKCFVYVAGGEKHKNHIKLFKAWKLLYEKFPELDVELIVTLSDEPGGLWQEASLLFDFKRLAITNRGVVPRSDVFDLYKSCDVLIFPSLRESFGLPLVEAQSFGLDVIASELDFVRDVVSPVESFDPNSEMSIARAIARYLELLWPSSIKPILARDLLVQVFEN